MANFIYDELKTGLLNGNVDFINDSIKVLLVQETNPNIITSAVSVGNTMTWEFSGSSATPLTEVSGVGYYYGGNSIYVSAVSADVEGTNKTFLTGSTITFPNSTITAGGALMYKTSTLNYLSGVPLIYFDFGASRSSSNGDFTLEWRSDGFLELE